MKKAFTLAAVAVLSVLTACGTFSPDQAAAIEGGLHDLAATGQITPEQLLASLQLLHEKTSSVDWNAVAAVGVSTVLAFFGIPRLVNSQRGPATQKVGLPPEQVRRLALEVANAAEKKDDKV